MEKQEKIEFSAQSDLFKILSEDSGNKGFQSMKDTVEEAKDYVKASRSGDRIVFRTKFPRLNRQLMGGLQPGKMYVIAGRPGCLSGDTMIWVARKSTKEGSKSNVSGRWYRLDCLYEQFNGLSTRNKWDLSIPTKINSYKYDDDLTGLNDVEDVMYSGEKEVFDVLLESGERIKATKDHRFLVGKNDKFKKLEDLNVGDDVFVRKKLKPKGRSKRVKRKVIIRKMPFYPSAREKKQGKYTYHRISEHRAIYDASINNLSLEDFIFQVSNVENNNLIFSDMKMDIHHVDGNATNNSLDNLALLTKDEHNKIHSDRARLGLNSISKSSIVSVTSAGIEKTYDISMKAPYHNFIANNFIVHNSGKSQFSNQLLFDIMDCAKEDGKKLAVIYWSFEMPGYQQLLRIASGDCGVGVYDLISDKSSITYQEYVDTIEKYRDYNIGFQNIPDTITRFKSVTTQFCKNNPDYTLINIVDHTRLFKGNSNDENQRLADVANGCMEAQAEHKSITIVLSQLNKNIEAPERKKDMFKPQLTDIFGSDSLSQNTHVAMMLNRPHDMYGITDPYCGENPENKMFVHITKNREGSLGIISYRTHYPSFKITETTK